MALTTAPVGANITKAHLRSGDRRSRADVVEAVARALVAPELTPAELRELERCAELVGRIDRGELAMPADVVDAMRANLEAAVAGGQLTEWDPETGAIEVRTGPAAAADRFGIHAAYHQALDPGGDVPPLSFGRVRPSRVQAAGGLVVRLVATVRARSTRPRTQRRRHAGTRSSRGTDGGSGDPADIAPDANGAPPQLAGDRGAPSTRTEFVARPRAYLAAAAPQTTTPEVLR